MFRIGPQPVTQLGCGNMFVCSKTLLWAFESACSAQESFRGVQMTSLTKSRQFPVCFCVIQDFIFCPELQDPASHQKVTGTSYGLWSHRLKESLCFGSRGGCVEGIHLFHKRGEKPPEYWFRGKLRQGGSVRRSLLTRQEEDQNGNL